MLSPWFYIGGVGVVYGIPAYRELNSASLGLGEYESFKKATLDPYVAMRSAYYESRAEAVEKSKAKKQRPSVASTPLPRGDDQVGIRPPCPSPGGPTSPGQHPASTNGVPAEERTALEPVDVAAITRVNQNQEYFSDQDKYGGILYKAYRADNPLQLINPFAPGEYGQSEAAELQRDRTTGVPSGLSVFSIRFK